MLIYFSSTPTCQESNPSVAALVYLSSSQDAPTPLKTKQKKKKIRENKQDGLNSEKSLMLTFEASPSSRLVGIGTTTWELEALSSVTEPCRRCFINQINQSHIYQIIMINQIRKPLCLIFVIYKIKLWMNKNIHTWCLLIMSFSFPSSFGSISALR